MNRGSKQSVLTDKIHKSSKDGSKSKHRSTVRSDVIVDSKDGKLELLDGFDVNKKREKALTILENEKSGNPFEETEEANSVHMYYPAEQVQNASKTHSLSGSMHSKREKVKTSFPKITAKRGSSQNSNHEEDFDNSKMFKLTKEQRNLVNNSRAKPNEFGNSRRKMGSYDINATKSMDRELKKQKIEGPSKDTIMTVNEATYSCHRLDEMRVNQYEQTSNIGISNKRDLNIRLSSA